MHLGAGMGRDVQGHQERGVLGFGRGVAPHVHILIPLGHGMAAATDHGPVTPSMSLVCPLSVSLVGRDGGGFL